jgi:hypothetical protein
MLLLPADEGPIGLEIVMAGPAEGRDPAIHVLNKKRGWP